MKTKDLLAAVAKYHDYSWIFVPELRVGTGYGKDVEQRIDAWAIHPWPSKGLLSIAYEIKASRKDWLSELKKPLKRRQALLYSNLFYFVTPPGLVKEGELPIETGLMELHDIKLKTIVEAPRREIHPPTWAFVASLMRRLGGGTAISHWGTWACVCGERVLHGYKDELVTHCDKCGRMLVGRERRIKQEHP